MRDPTRSHGDVDRGGEVARAYGLENRFFQLRPGAWARLVEGQLQQIAAFRRLCEEKLTALEDAPPAQRQRLAEIESLYGALGQELPAVLRRWSAQRGLS